MKLISRRFSRKSLQILTVALATATIPLAAHAQQIYVSDTNGGTISEYDLQGNPIGTNPFLSNLGNPFGVAVSGNDLYEANYGGDTISVFNVLTGLQVGSGPLITSGLDYPTDIAIAGNELFVTNLHSGNVGLYDATTGAPIGSTPFISSLNSPEYLTVSGNDLYVSTFHAIYEYDATTGAQIGSHALVGGLSNARGIAVDGNDLYVADANAGTITVYDATTGAQVGPGPLVTGLDGPRKIQIYDGNIYVSDVGDNSIMAYNEQTGEQVGNCWPAGNPNDFFIVGGDPAAVPEPSTWAMLGAGLLLVTYVRSRRAQSAALATIPRA